MRRVIAETQWRAVLIALGGMCIAAAGRAEQPDWLVISPDLDHKLEIEEGSPDIAGERSGEWIDEGFGYVELEWQSHIRIKTRSKVVHTQRMVRLFVTNAGAQQAGTFEILVKTSRSKLFIDRAYLLLPGGLRQAVDPESIQITDPQDPNLFTDVKNVSVPMSGIVPGSIAYIEFRIERAIDEDPLPWSSLSTLQTSVPILSNEIIVENDRAADWYAWKTNDPELVCESDSDGRLICRRSETAAVKADPAVRSYYDIIPHLIVAERVSWADYAARVGRLVESKLDVSEAMTKTIERIRSEFASPEERAEEVYRIVANQVRYLGFEHGDSAVVPHAASLTWDRRFGDCKDKVTLFVAMAHALGIEARPVLTSTSFFEPENAILPAASYFDHMIVCSNALVRDDGCVDVTLSSSPAELPYTLQGGLALDLTGSNTNSVRALPRRAVLWEVTVEREIDLQCDGEVVENVAYRQAGPWGDTLRSALVQLSPGERSQYMRNDYALATGSAETRPVMKLSGLSKLSEPWAVTYSSRGARRVEMTGIQHFYDVDPWFSYFARSLVAENQHHDYGFPGIRLEAVSRYRVCEDAKIGYTGAVLDLKGRWGTLARHYEVDLGSVIVRSTLSMSSRSISPSELLDLRVYLARSLDQSAIQFEYRFE